MTDSTWRKCSSCKEPIAFDVTYWACNVSTCNSKRMGLFFCSVSCWEAHLPTMRHRESWAVEKTAPGRGQWQQQKPVESPAARATSRPVSSPAPRQRAVVSSAPARSDDLPRDILVVVSKLKKYIKAKSGFNTSDSTMTALSDHIRALCDQAIREAGKAERRTVMGRDFPTL